MELLNTREFQETSQAAFENGSDTLRQNCLLGNYYFRKKIYAVGIENQGPAVIMDKKVDFPNYYQDAFYKKL